MRYTSEAISAFCSPEKSTSLARVMSSIQEFLLSDPPEQKVDNEGMN